MPGFVLNQGSSVVCLHAGQAQPTVPAPRVKVAGQLVIPQTCSYTIAGCTLPPPNAGNGPCVTGQWVSAATRVRVSGKPVVIQGSQAVCAPTGTGLNVVMTQTRVRAT